MKRYQVFVSSTYDDLKEERSRVIQALLNINCIPCGMEYFPAADEDAWACIERLIPECDYYVVILAGMYGSIPDGQTKSFTHLEYELALKHKVPALGLLHRTPETLASNRCESVPARRKKLVQFRTEVKRKLCRFWETADQLPGELLSSLTQQIDRNPRTGWVRATDVPSSETISEFARLSRENEELRKRVSKSEAPEFEILAAGLWTRQTGNPRIRMVVLVHYEGSPLYIPSTRCILEFEGPAGSWKLPHIVRNASSLIERRGTDLQINGGGFFELISRTALPTKELGESANIKLEMSLRTGSSIVLTAAVEAPEWWRGEKGVDGFDHPQ